MIFNGVLMGDLMWISWKVNSYILVFNGVVLESGQMIKNPTDTAINIWEAPTVDL